MNPLDRLKILRASAQAKADYIDNQLDNLERMLDKLGVLLNKQIVDDFMSGLSVDNGIIVSDIQNQRKTALIDKAYDTFMQQNGYKVVTKMITDLYEVSGMNLDYFSELEGMKVDGTDINKIVNERLGLNEKGELKREGFMKGLLDDPTVKNEIKNFAINKTIGGTGYEDLRAGLKEMVAGSEEKMGKFKQFYRNAAYDTYARIDALNGKLYGDKLNLNYFIYAGTRRKASRHFCIKRKGGLFSREEALKWKALIGTTTHDEKGKRVPAGPIVSGEDVATYNPFVDRGGYGCVDDIMWVSDEVAFSMRPELKKSSSEEKLKDEAKEDKKKNTPTKSTKKETPNPPTESKEEKKSIIRDIKKLADELKAKQRELLKKAITGKEYLKIKSYDSGGMSAVHKDADKGSDYAENVKTVELYAKVLGAIATVNKHAKTPGKKNPELTIDGKLADNKKPNHSDHSSGTPPYKNISSAISNAAKGAIKQKAIPVVILEKRYSLPDIIKGAKYAFEAKGVDGTRISELHLRYRDDAITIVTRRNYEDGDYDDIIAEGYQRP